MELVVFSLNYSSWSVRAWLALDHAGVPFRVRHIGGFVEEGWREKLLAISGAARVPVLLDGGLTLHESLAICEYVAERHPEAALWPQGARARARARAVSCEMMSGFHRVRQEMPMSLRGRAKGFAPSEQAQGELARIFQLWEEALDRSGGPFLFGAFGVADCMYMPVLSRLRTYGVGAPTGLQSYVDAMWGQPSVARWATLAQGEPAIPMYDEALG
jgi:glutathione S-transferase